MVMKALRFFMYVFLCFFSIMVFAQQTDPTKPLPFQQAFLGNQYGIVVTSLLIGKERVAAVVNQQIVGVGDEILGNKIISIDMDGVHFQSPQGKEFSVSVHPLSIKKRVIK